MKAMASSLLQRTTGLSCDARAIHTVTLVVASKLRRLELGRTIHAVTTHPA